MKIRIVIISRLFLILILILMTGCMKYTSDYEVKLTYRFDWKNSGYRVANTDGSKGFRLHDVDINAFRSQEYVRRVAVWDCKGKKISVLDAGFTDGLFSNVIYVDLYDGGAMDYHDHGDHVLGIVETISENAEILAVRVTDGQNFNMEKIRDAIIYAVDWGADSINMSFGGGLYDPYGDPLYQGVKYALDHGVLVVASSGNDGSYYIDYPAAYAGVYAVGSLSLGLKRSSFSNLGDIWGYGENIMSVGGYKSGTSMSSPQAAVYMLFNDILSLRFGIMGEKSEVPYKVIYKNGLDEILTADVIDGKFQTITKTVKDVHIWRDENENGKIDAGDLYGEGVREGKTYHFEIERVVK